MRTADAALGAKTPPPPARMRMKVRDDGKAPIILIDGKQASEAQLAALDAKDLAAMAVYKDTEHLHLSDDGKGGLKVISDPSGVPASTDGRSIVSVTTKIAKAKASARQP